MVCVLGVCDHVGTAALQMMIQYAHTKLGMTHFFAKIGDANVASLSLFKKLGFVPHSHSEYFQETQLLLVVPSLSPCAGSFAWPVISEEDYSFPDE